MYYSAVCIIALLILIIVNQDVLFRHNAVYKTPALFSYKKFLISVFVYVTTDVLWGILREAKMPRLFFIDTSLNYIAMAVGVWFWMGYIVTYYKDKKALKVVFLNLGRIFAAGVTALVCINAFKPILFTVDEAGKYTAASNSFLIQLSQALILLFLLLHSFSIVFIRHTEKRQRYGFTALFALIMVAFMITQFLYYDLPYYSIAYLLGSCLLHFFVIEDEKEIFMRETALAANQEILNASLTYENIIKMLSKEYFDLFYIDLKTDEYIEYGSRTDFSNRFSEKRGRDFFKTIRKNADKLVFEEDRKGLVEALNKENVINEIETNGFFGCYYRLMVDGEPIYVNLKATGNSSDPDHIIIGITNVDAQMKEHIYAENAKEDQKAYLRLNAFSRNLIAFYVVDPETDEYTEFNSTSEFEELGISKKGSNFFEETYKNSLNIINKNDLENFHSKFTKKYILECIKRDGIFVLEYRLMLGGKPTYVRLKASEIEEDGKTLLVLGVENVDMYVRREQNQAYELSLARELASKDSLTGVRNRHSYLEAKSRLNKQIDNGEISEFAIVICDINGLKIVNDTMGHQAGDELIRRACNRICDIFKHSRVYRIGGDEFAIICQGKDYENITELLRKMNTANINQKDVQIAFGMSRFCLGESVEDVANDADALMYEHKALLKAKIADDSGTEKGKNSAKYQFPETIKKVYESSPLSYVYYQNINDKAVPVLVSDGFCRNTGLPRENAISWLANGMFERMHPDDVGVMAQISDDFLHQRGEYDAVFRCKLSNEESEKGKAKYVFMHGLGKWQTMPDGTQLAVITYGNISKSQNTTDAELETYLQHRHDSFYNDALTGLPNINYLMEYGDEKLNIIRDSGKTPNIVYIDVYSMQSYNNQYGFKEGDRLLCLIAKTLSKQFPRALVTREAGDHFIMISYIDDREKLERQLNRVNRTIRTRAHGNTSGVRFGVCPMTEEVATLNEAIDHAKMALKAIENDMNRDVEFFTNTSNLLYLQDRYIIENLDRAIKEGWIKLYYHSIFRSETKKISAFECLARWDDPVRGMIYPGVFINVLIKYHLLYKLDMFMFEQACREVKERYDNGLPLVPVSINFSRQDFDHIDVVAEMNRLYDKYNMKNYVDKSYFVVEITEQDIEAGKEVFKEQLEKIKENNYGLWLDDFGSGYSAISSFSQYDFDLIKFDMELVKNLDDDRGVNQILLEDMVGLAKKLGIHTLIEGAETQEQIDFIRKIGCELVQGYYFTKPEPLDSILKRVKATGNIRTCEEPEERAEFIQKWFE